MAEAAKKQMSKPAFSKDKIILKGIVKFSNLKTATAFKEGEPGHFDITLLIDENDEQLDMITALHKEAVDFELSELPKAKRQAVAVKPSPIRTDTDRDGNETGMMSLKLRRKEAHGAPVVMDSHRQKLDKEFIRKGSEVKVQIRAYSYNVANAVGIALVLEGVQIIKEADLPEGYTPRSREPEIVFESIDENEIF